MPQHFMKPAGPPSQAPNVGMLMQPQQSPLQYMPTQDAAEIRRREQGWLDYFGSPEVQAGLLQFAMAVTAPRAPGQSGLNQTIGAIGQGFGAAGRVAGAREEQARAAREEARAERQIGLEERRVRVSEEQPVVERERIRSQERVSEREQLAADRRAREGRTAARDLATLEHEFNVERDRGRHQSALDVARTYAAQQKQAFNLQGEVARSYDTAYEAAIEAQGAFGDPIDFEAAHQAGLRAAQGKRRLLDPEFRRQEDERTARNTVAEASTEALRAILADPQRQRVAESLHNVTREMIEAELARREAQAPPPAPANVAAPPQLPTKPAIQPTIPAPAPPPQRQRSRVRGPQDRG